MRKNKVLWILLILMLAVMFTKKSGYVYAGELDQEYQGQHPYRGRVSSIFSYNSPSEWKFDNFNKTTALNVPGVGNAKGMVGVYQ